MSVAIQCLGFAAGIASISLVFMRLVDRVNQKLLSGIGGGFGQQSFFQLWSGELFPTLLRGTAQGLMFAVVRIALGFWSLYVPTLTKTGFSALAWILTGFVACSGLIGFLFAPRNEGKTLAQIQRERHAGVIEAPRHLSSR